MKDLLKVESGTSIMNIRPNDVAGEEIAVPDARFVIGDNEPSVLPYVRSQWSDRIGLRHQPAEQSWDHRDDGLLPMNSRKGTDVLASHTLPLQSDISPLGEDVRMGTPIL